MWGPHGLQGPASEGGWSYPTGGGALLTLGGATSEAFVCISLSSSNVTLFSQLASGMALGTGGGGEKLGSGVTNGGGLYSGMSFTGGSGDRSTQTWSPIAA